MCFNRVKQPSFIAQLAHRPTSNSVSCIYLVHGTETEKNVAKIDIGKISKLDNNIEFTEIQGVFSVPLPLK